MLGAQLAKGDGFTTQINPSMNAVSLCLVQVLSREGQPSPMEVAG